MEKFICLFCKKNFEDYPSIKRRYCSRICSGKGSPLTGKDHHAWNGGKRKFNDYIGVIVNDKHPYAFKHSGKKLIYEHRYVMEQSLDRYLKPNERVHHKNRNKLDNRIENLVLFSNNSEHLKEHWKNNDMQNSKKKWFKKGQIPWNKKTI